MKSLLFCIFLMMFSCKKNEELFDPYTYDGEYPKSLTGEAIQTYSPAISGGEINVLFNGHPWNHAPYLSVYTTIINAGDTNSGVSQLEVGIATLLTKPLIDPCVFERIHLRIPAQAGKFVFDKSLSFQDEITARFYSVNCDATKDNYQLDPSKDNWIDIKHYDAASRSIEAEFNTNFIIERRNSSFGPIYPKHVSISGSIKAVAKVLK
jgi:hypothetical protein